MHRVRCRTGDPQVTPAAFWQHVDRAGSCWIWRGPRHRQGYGRAGRNVAHRIAFELAHGPFDRRLKVCHHCDNPPCVNPAHLFLGTQRDNVQDMVRKGRGWWRVYAGRTRCANGHPWAPENLRPGRKGLACRVCERERMRRARGNSGHEGLRWRAERPCCGSGHEYTTANTRWKRKGSAAPYRQCRECARLQAKTARALR